MADHAQQVTFKNKGNIALILLAAAILGSAMPMLIVLGGLAGLTLTPHPTLSTLPPSMQMLAGLFAAAPISYLMGRKGRKAGFVVSAGFAAIGGLLGGIAMLTSQFWMLIAAHIALGAALVGINYFRFAASEIVPKSMQSVVISFVLGAGLISALIGPEVFNRTKDLLAPVPFAGAYFAIIPIVIIGLVPILLARFAKVAETSQATLKPVSVRNVIKRRPVLLAVLAGSISGGIMVLLMTPTPLAMTHHGHSEIEASSVIKWHVIAMFAPSFVTGWIIKRLGVINVIAMGMALLAGACGLAAAGISLHHFYSALIVLGIGWNFGFIGATTLLAQSLEPHERAKVQGFNDTALALSLTLASFASGALVTHFSWDIVAITALPILGAMLIMLIIFRKFTKAEMDQLS